MGTRFQPRVEKGANKAVLSDESSLPLATWSMLCAVSPVGVGAGTTFNSAAPRAPLSPRQHPQFTHSGPRAPGRRFPCIFMSNEKGIACI